MKTVTADLSDEGRQDILEKVRSYRGGAFFCAPDLHNYLLILSSGYTPEVRVEEHVFKPTLKNMKM